MTKWAIAIAAAVLMGVVVLVNARVISDCGWGHYLIAGKAIWGEWLWGYCK